MRELEITVEILFPLFLLLAAEYERAKRYYQKLTGSDLVIAD